MKTFFSIVSLLAAIPAVLAAGYCVEDMEYCGSTLVKMGKYQRYYCSLVHPLKLVTRVDRR